jgi:hypothetical protein
MRQSSQAVTSSLVAAVLSASAAIPASAGVVTVVPNLASADDSGRFIQYIEEYSPATVRYCLAEGLASRYGSAVASSLDRTLQRLTVAASQPDISPNGCSPFSHEVVVNTYSVGVDAPSAAVLVDPEPTEPVSVFGASVAVLADGGRMPGSSAQERVLAVGDPYCSEGTPGGGSGGMSGGGSGGGGGAEQRGKIFVFDLTKGGPRAEPFTCSTGIASLAAPYSAIVGPAGDQNFGGQVRMSRHLANSALSRGQALLGASHGVATGGWSHLSLYKVLPASLAGGAGATPLQVLNLQTAAGNSVPAGWARAGKDFAMENDLLVVASVLTPTAGAAPGTCAEALPIHEVLVFRRVGELFQLQQRFESRGMPALGPALDVDPCQAVAVAPHLRKVSVDIEGNRIVVGMPWSEGLSMGRIATFGFADGAWQPELVLDAPAGTSEFGKLVALGDGSHLAFSVKSNHRDPSQDGPCWYSSVVVGKGNSPSVECPDQSCLVWLGEARAVSEDMILVDLGKMLSGNNQTFAVRRSGGTESSTWSGLAFSGPQLVAASDGAKIYGPDDCKHPCAEGGGLDGVARGAIVMHSTLPGGCGSTQDLNGDTFVDAADMGMLLGAFGVSTDCRFDFNRDGAVNSADLGILLGAWGPVVPRMRRTSEEFQSPFCFPNP